MANTREIKWEPNQRKLFGSNTFSAYRSQFSDKLTSTSASIITLGINFLYDKLASHRQDWMQAIQKECTYTKKLAMQTEIVDFYKEPSTQGALDPANIVFSGFGCRQFVETNVGDRQDTLTVFYIYCNLRTDEIGCQRITNHSKFEVEVDSIYFDPYHSNLPNDSVVDAQNSIKFDFSKRKDLSLSLTANFTSSWMNEAIQINKDVQLGEFKVNVRIDEEDLRDSVFTYKRSREANSRKGQKVSVTGDCFIVPRSYVGTLDGTAFTNAWGTGQYKLEMQLSESCNINQEYYMEKQTQTHASDSNNKKGKKSKEKWNDNWKEEWKIIKKRKTATSLFCNMKDAVVTEWKGKEWITTIIEPISTAITDTSNQIIGGSSNGGGNSGPSGSSGGNAHPF